MSRYPAARFVTSANKSDQFVPDVGAEVAVAGRSNAGKSSAINVIVGRKQFARTSRTPGRTQLVNFFTLGDDRRLVDLPGYGYARVPEATRRHWAALIERYFEARDSLTGLILVVDIRRRLTDFDDTMLGFAAAVGLPVHVLLTKADKLKRGQAARALAEVRAALAGRATVQQFSALDRRGADEARDVLDAFLADAQPAADS